jgi:hypothetical protein
LAILAKAALFTPGVGVTAMSLGYFGVIRGKIVAWLCISVDTLKYAELHTLKG